MGKLLEELDRKMAEVMGWHCDVADERIAKRTGPAILLGTHIYRNAKGRAIMPAAHWKPHACIEQAMRVLDRLKEQPFSVKYWFLENIRLQARLEKDGLFGGSPILPVERSWWFFFIANRPLAICKAVEAAWEKGGDGE